MIVHLHIPKNGGTTIDEGILKPLFGRDFVPFYEPVVHEPLSPQEQHDFFLRHRAARAVSSHRFRYPFPDIEGLAYQSLTLLREPAERMVSLYFHEKRTAAAHDPDHRAHQPLDVYLERLIEQDALTGFQCGYLDPGRDLEAAQEVLRRLTLVGVVERYDEALILLSRMLGLPWHAMAVLPRNVGKPAGAERYISADLRRRVARASGPDVDLYHFAADLLTTARRNAGRTFWLDLQRLRFANWRARRRARAV